MVVLWILQVLFLNNFYDVMKDEQTQRVAKAIEADYKQKSTHKFLKSIENISNSNDMRYGEGSVTSSDNSAALM